MQYFLHNYVYGLLFMTNFTAATTPSIAPNRFVESAASFKETAIQETMINETVIINFTDQTLRAWQIVNDNVMGGISRSSFKWFEEGYAVFSGTVSLENNGGFASVRTQSRTPVDLSQFKGLTLRALGDGNIYCIRLRTVENGRITWYTHQARFQTKQGEWQTHIIPFSSFKAEFRGSNLRGNPPLNPEAVVEIGFMIQDKQEGAFRLGIQNVSGYR
jgi:monofunctional biosynthetic peptidoglycan transglycosylase